MWGRAKLIVLLRAEGVVVSESTVGRILGHLVARGVLQPVPVLRRANVKLRRRRPHAQRLPKGHLASCPSSLVQLDTLTITLQPGVSIKQFTAYCPGARWTVANALTPRDQHRGRPLPRQAAGGDAVRGHRPSGRRRLGIHG